ncbi:Hypothetical protein AAM4_0753 [Actinomyces succiniciruminis]|uniref:Uncharacterized protein n=2 Tax=Actinomyces succiniciruminis TaxID=1522002 RepID=A0A1L7R9R0_9ACTO|nr:Hypothetical protein AAM4_0753 [Actinomyces succiniciruminis]
MTRLYPFRALFVGYAQVRFPQRRKLESKVEALIDASPRFYRFVCVSDSVFVGVLCLLMVGALAGNIYAVFIR